MPAAGYPSMWIRAPGSSVMPVWVVNVPRELAGRAAARVGGDDLDAPVEPAVALLPSQRDVVLDDVPHAVAARGTAPGVDRVARDHGHARGREAPLTRPRLTAVVVEAVRGRQEEPGCDQRAGAPSVEGRPVDRAVVEVGPADGEPRHRLEAAARAAGCARAHGAADLRSGALDARLRDVHSAVEAAGAHATLDHARPHRRGGARGRLGGARAAAHHGRVARRVGAPHPCGVHGLGRRLVARLLGDRHSGGERERGDGNEKKPCGTHRSPSPGGSTGPTVGPVAPRRQARR